MTTRRRSLFPFALLAALLSLASLAPGAAAQTVARVRDLTSHAGDVPRRLVGYGLVVGLDGTGDRNHGWSRSETPTVRSIVNLLRRFHVEVPPEQLRPRNVAAVLVSAEVSPYLGTGGRFQVQVGALGDATSLRGGQLWITPLVTDPNEPPVATAQGSIYVPTDDTRGYYAGRSNSGRIPDGGILEADLPAAAPEGTRLLLRRPDLGTASRIAGAVNAAFGASVAKVENPGSVSLAPPAEPSADRMAFLAAVDTVLVTTLPVARVIIDAREGTVVAGGRLRVGPAAVTHHGVTLEVGGGRAAPGGSVQGLVRVDAGATLQDVAAGLHAAGLKPQEMAAVLEALRAAGALEAEVIIQ